MQLLMLSLFEIFINQALTQNLKITLISFLFPIYKVYIENILNLPCAYIQCTISPCVIYIYYYINRSMHLLVIGL